MKTSLQRGVLGRMCSLVGPADAGLAVLCGNLVGYAVLWLCPPEDANAAGLQVLLRLLAFGACSLFSVVMCLKLKKCTPGSRWAAGLSFCIHFGNLWNVYIVLYSLIPS